ncbi:hypothetical protein AB4254_08520 [Vibrio breoganii]
MLTLVREFKTSDVVMLNILGFDTHGNEVLIEASLNDMSKDTSMEIKVSEYNGNAYQIHKAKRIGSIEIGNLCLGHVTKISRSADPIIHFVRETLNVEISTTALSNDCINSAWASHFSSLQRELNTIIH